jgi:DNA-binding NarL/FixJ family response regulator
MEIKTLIADQERVFAEALAARLNGEIDITVMGAVQAGMPSHWLTGGKSVDIVLLDGDLAGGAANRLCAELVSGDRPVQVIALSSSSQPERIVNAIQAGAAAWVRKDESLEQLLRAIRGVARGETWLSPRELSNVVRFLLQERDRHRKDEQILAALTPRERAVLTCMVEGAGHRDAVAEQLHLSVNTVRTHLQNLMAKLGVHSTLEAVALTREQLIREDGDWLSANGSPLGDLQAPVDQSAERRGC